MVSAWLRKKLDNMSDAVKRSMNIRVAFLLPSILLLGLNSIQLFSNWTIWSETQRLKKLAMHSPDDFQNPAPIADHFEDKVSPDFWNFSIINGGGKVSNTSD